MDNLVMINNTELQIKEYKGQRVVTFKDIDIVHKRANGTAGRNFRENKMRFIEGEDYFQLKPQEFQPDEIRRFGIESPKGGYVITENGYLMLVKSFTDDLAWKVQRDLVNIYFKSHELISVPNEISSEFMFKIAQSMKALEDKNKLLEYRAEEAEETVEVLEGKIEEDRPKVDCYDKLVSSKNLYDMGEVASILNCEGYGKINLFKFLRESKILMTKNHNKNIPFRRFIESGLFQVKNKTHNKNGYDVAYKKTYVTQKGVMYIKKKLEEELGEKIYIGKF